MSRSWEACVVGKVGGTFKSSEVSQRSSLLRKMLGFKSNRMSNASTGAVTSQSAGKKLRDPQNVPDIMEVKENAPYQFNVRMSGPAITITVTPNRGGAGTERAEE